MTTIYNWAPGDWQHIEGEEFLQRVEDAVLVSLGVGGHLGHLGLSSFFVLLVGRNCVLPSRLVYLLWPGRNCVLPFSTSVARNLGFALGKSLGAALPARAPENLKLAGN